MIQAVLGRCRLRAWRRRSGPGAVILAYHRVAEVDTDPWGLCVSPRDFGEHLEVLRDHVRLMALDEVVRALRDGNLPPRSAAVTFDDGYADNLQNAGPLLTRYDVPATISITTGGLESEREFWWDELDRLLLQPGTLPRTLQLTIGHKTHEWSLGDAAELSQKLFERCRSWRVWRRAPSERHRIYLALWRRLRPLTEADRRGILDELVRWAGATTKGRPTHLCVSPRDVAELAGNELLTVGAHTVTHPALPSLPAATQRDEIMESKNRLERILGRPVRGFAYPFGVFTPETVSIVREAGFTSACTMAPDLVHRGSDPYRLPRVHVQSWDGDEFAKRMRRGFAY